MRLAIYYDIITGRNDGNPLYVWRALKRRQEKGLLEIDHLAPKEDVHLFGTYDANIWVDWGEDALAPIIPYRMINCPAPNLYWASDTHLGYDYRLAMAKKFDHVFVAQKRAVEEFERDGVKAEWLPHAFEPEAYPVFEYPLKEYDLCFIGHINNDKRIEFLDRMFKEFPNFFYGQRRFEEASEKFSRSKICLNISHVDDINMRTFEVMGTRSFLLTEWLPTLEDLFKDGVHLATFKTFDEAVDKAKYYLAHDDEREKIAQAGYDEVLKNHTIDNRVDRMLEIINQKLLVKA